MPTYMVVERFKDARAVYERFRDKGRMAPVGLEYIESWVDADVTICFQIMRTEDRSLLDEWASHWNDIVDFEFIPVISGADASRQVLSAQ